MSTKILTLIKLLRSDNVHSELLLTLVRQLDQELKQLTQLQREEVLEQFMVYPSLSLTQFEIRLLCDELNQDELTVAKQAKKEWVHRTTVYRRIKKQGITRSKPINPNIAIVKDLLERKWDRKIIAQKLGVSRQAVDKLIKNHLS